MPFLSYPHIHDLADQFLNRYHPSRTIPVPIEEILDNQIGLHIYPSPELYRIHRQNGYLAHNRRTIWVDEYQYNNYPYKYRFTLAHELGHYVLHAEYYQEIEYSTIDEYLHWRLSIPPKELDWMETHADWFAGCILLPLAALETACLQVLQGAQPPFPETLWQSDEFWEYAVKDLMDHFEVNPGVIAAQIRKDKVIERLKRRISQA